MIFPLLKINTTEFCLICEEVKVVVMRGAFFVFDFGNYQQYAGLPFYLDVWFPCRFHMRLLTFKAVPPNRRTSQVQLGNGRFLIAGNVLYAWKQNDYSYVSELD